MKILLLKFTWDSNKPILIKKLLIWALDSNKLLKPRLIRNSTPNSLSFGETMSLKPKKKKLKRKRLLKSKNKNSKILLKLQNKSSNILPNFNKLSRKPMLKSKEKFKNKLKLKKLSILLRKSLNTPKMPEPDSSEDDWLVIAFYLDL